MTRYRLDIAYDGGAFHGWAAQPGLRTVQGELEAWMTRILRLDAPSSLTCAGRTDTGVHARGQVAHVDLPAPGLADQLLHRLGRVLPGDLVVRAASEVPESFDARFSALWRRYTFRLADSAPDPLLRGLVLRVRSPLDAETMDPAARSLVGLHDFGAFCKRREGATTIREILQAHAEREADGTVAVTLRADAFCHSMVRSLVGAVWAVGAGRRDLAWLERVAAHPVRHNDVYVMPAHGLCLERVGYPPDDQLADRAEQARSLRTPQEVDR